MTYLIVLIALLHFPNTTQKLSAHSRVTPSMASKAQHGGQKPSYKFVASVNEGCYLARPGEFVCVPPLPTPPEKFDASHMRDDVMGMSGTKGEALGHAAKCETEPTHGLTR